jgi:asparagine synthase (glutamine-hydrolysing)
MCGIAGFISQVDTNDNQSNVKAMLRAIRHRGPDGSGCWIEVFEGSVVALGHQRLAILDLSDAGAQPMTYKHLTITFNGEIYNFRAIRKELVDSGFTFKSDTDTEVVLKAISFWGPQAVEKFRGMFAFALWNSRDKSMLLCRDRLGVKPLYWAKQGQYFYFASEVKSFCAHPRFRRQLNLTATQQFFSSGSVPAPNSIFEDVHKLLPGRFLFIKNNVVRSEKYWEIRKRFIGISDKNSRLIRSEQQILDELEENLSESCSLRMVSDVPVGMFLSGGVDSTLVAAILRKLGYNIKTFTIGFTQNDTVDEAAAAREIADYLGCDHTEYYYKPTEVCDVLGKLGNVYDEPFGDSSALPTYLVSAIASRDAKVVLSADGGDELFCGYNHYYGKGARRLKYSIPVLSILVPSMWSSIVLSEKYCPRNLRRAIQAERDTFTWRKRFKESLQTYSSFDWDEKQFLMLYDIKTYLPDDLLVKVDRSTMIHSIEGREPFLDHKLVEYAFQLETSWKHRNGTSKYILRKLLGRFLPNKMIERPKQGFSIPLDYGLYRSELLAACRRKLTAELINDVGVFKPTEVFNVLNRWEAKKTSYLNPWRLLAFYNWAERWLL